LITELLLRYSMLTNQALMHFRFELARFSEFGRGLGGRLGGKGRRGKGEGGRGKGEREKGKGMSLSESLEK
jgi:hypothetical protein